MPWPATVIQRAFAQVPNKSLHLRAGDYVRPLFIGNNWARIRIGILASVYNYDSMVISLTNLPLYLGICSGSDAPVGAAWTRSFLGASLFGTPFTGTSNNFTIVGTTYWNTTACTPFRKYENLITGVAGSNATASPSLQAYKKRFPYFVDIERPVSDSGLVTIKVYGCNAAQSIQDFRPSDFLAGLDQLSAPVAGQITLTQLASVATLGSSDLHGPLDTFNLYWGRCAYPLEVFALGASVIYENTRPITVDATGYDSMRQYNNGSIINFTGGTGWSGAGFPATVGTNIGNPYPQICAGSGTYSGTLYPFAGTYFPALFSGTTVGWPLDEFESYAIGTITSGVTVSAGSGWASPAVIA
jgi:hypothetical protein